MNVENKRILVVGLGRTGQALARYLKVRGAHVTATDSAEEQTLGRVVEEMVDLGINMELGCHHAGAFEKAEMILLSPGVPHTLEPIQAAKDRGIPVIGEIEFASRHIHVPIVAVTGTNGKTTTTALLGEMLAQSGLDVFVGGNIGDPLMGYVARDPGAQVVVVEVSSFQLDTIDRFRPGVAVLLNISEDHLDRYPDFNGYVASKAGIFRNQTTEDIAIVNGADPLSRDIVRDIKSRVWYVNAGNGEYGAVIDDGGIVFHTPRIATHRLNRSEIPLPGRHNLENVAAACLAAIAGGGTMAGCRSALNAFKGFPHRLEEVAVINGIRYINDSKATNVDAVQKALETYSDPVLLILGGRDKGGAFERLNRLIRKRVKHLVVMGEARGVIADALDATIPYKPVSTLAEAVEYAAGLAFTGDIVLLSPGCTSFDRYNSYEDRGDDFRAVVSRLKKDTP